LKYYFISFNVIVLRRNNYFFNLKYGAFDK